MRMLILARLKGNHDPDQQLLQGVLDWQRNHSPVIESFHFFAGGRGGAAVINVPDERSVNALVMDWDFLVLSDLEFQPLVDIRMVVQVPIANMFIADMPINVQDPEEPTGDMPIN